MHFVTLALSIGKVGVEASNRFTTSEVCQLELTHAPPGTELIDLCAWLVMNRFQARQVAEAITAWLKEGDREPASCSQPAVAAQPAGG